MGLHDQKSQNEDWVDRWSRNLAAAIQRGWPPTRDWVKLRGEELALGAKVMWPPTRHWIKYWWRRTDIAVTRNSRSYGRSIRKPAAALVSSASETRALRPLQFWGRLLLIAGLIVAFCFLFLYDTSVNSPGVDTPFGYIRGERFHNLGLQQNRTLGSIAGMMMAAVGALMLVIDIKIPPKEE